MYSHPFVPKVKQFGPLRRPGKRGRKSALAKFLEVQRDLFPVERAVAAVAPHYLIGAGRGDAAAPARSGARTDAAPAPAGAALGKSIRDLPSTDGGGRG